MGLGYTAQSALVMANNNGVDQGAEIKRRMDALKISDREFYNRTGIDRKTLNRAIGNEPGVRRSTYMAIETALDKLEAFAAGEPTTVTPTAEGDYVEFTVEGNFGVRAVVRGPVKDMEELQRAVGRLVREMRGDSE